LRSLIEAWRFHGDASKTTGASPASSSKWWRLTVVVDEDGELHDEGLTPTKDEDTCLRRLSMFRKEVH